MRTSNNSNSKNFFVKAAFTVWFAFFATASFASNYYWVGGTGNWSDYGTHWATASGGVIFHTTVPSSLDNVYFDVNSFSSQANVTLDVTTPYCNNMDWTGAQFNPSFNQPLGAYTTLNLYGSLTAYPGVQFGINGLNFLAPAGTKFITSNGTNLPSIILSGAATFNLTDDLTTYSLSMNNGTFFNSNSYNITLQNIVIRAAVINLGSSLITCGDNMEIKNNPVSFASSNASLVFLPTTFMEYTGNGSITPIEFDSITFLGEGFINVPFSINCNYLGCAGIFSFNTGALQTNYIHKGVFFDDVGFLHNTIFDSLLFNNPGHQVLLKNPNTTISINQEMSASGTCGQPISISGGIISKSSGAVTLNYLILNNNIATGGATFTANNSVDAGNNLGWAINSTAPHNLYWVGGSGNWSDINHWALSSGGAGGNCVPSLNDNVYFDVNSFSSQANVTLDVTTPYCNNMDWTGAQFNPSFNQPLGAYTTLNLYGSLTAYPGVQFGINGLNFLAPAGTKFITSNGTNLPSIILSGAATFNLTDDLTTYSLSMNNGTFFNSNSYNITLQNIVIRAAVINLGSSLITCGDNMEIKNNPVSFASSNASLVFLPTTFMEYTGNGSITPIEFDSITFLGEGFINVPFSINCNYLGCAGIFSFNTGALQTNYIHKGVFFDDVGFLHNTIFDSLLFNNPGHQVLLKNPNTTISINQEMSASGTCGQPISISGGIISKSSGAVTLNYLILNNNIATGGATFTANNSVDAGNNLGWAINSTAPHNLYWVGGSGNWSDINHWALSSGGAGGNCVPSLNDNVYFDVNSFSSQANVTLDVTTPYCNNMDWTGAQFNPSFNQPLGAYTTLNLYGSLTAYPGVQFGINGLNFLAPAGTKFITSNGTNLPSIILSGAATFNLTDDLTTYSLSMNNGTFFNSNSYNITLQNIVIRAAVINLGSSLITCGDNMEIKNNPVSFASSNASLVFLPTTFMEYTGNGSITPIEFDSITFLGEGFINVPFSINCNYLGCAGIFSFNTGALQTNYIHKGVFFDDVGFLHNTIFDSLLFNNPGHQVLLKNPNTTISINQEMSASVLPGLPTQISGGVISKSLGQVCLDYFIIQNSTVTGGASFYAGANSVDLGNNSGWLWSSCTPNTSNVWPGDANYDLTANNVDVLYVGLGYGYIGTTRAGASDVWVAQPSVDWLQQFASGVNLKNADCNGDGTIDNNDTTAVSLNYGQTHPFKLSQPLATNSGIPFNLVSSLDSAGLNFTVNQDMILGTNLLQLNNLYGLAFTLNFTPGFIDTNNVSFDFSNSMMGTAGVDLMTFTKSFASSGYIDVAMTRTDHTNISGFGHLASCGIVIVDNVAGAILQFSISNVTAFDNNEFPITLSTYGDSVVVDTTLLLSTHQIDLTQFISVYPNPSKENININGGLLNIQSVELISMMGEIIYSKKIDAHITSINTQKIKDGLYVLRCKTNKGIVNRRVQVFK